MSNSRLLFLLILMIIAVLVIFNGEQDIGQGMEHRMTK